VIKHVAVENPIDRTEGMRDLTGENRMTKEMNEE
jgi:hypothetical protein